MDINCHMKNMENTEKILAAIEALLFVYGEPMEINKISKLLKVKDEEVKMSLDELAKDFEDGDRGLRLIFSGNQVQLATKPEFSHLLENFIKEEFKEQLSPAALETLSLIIYLSPLSKSQLDYYRGVNSAFILRSLLIRGLIERFPDPKRSNIYIYQSSFDLLKYLGISKVEELPEYEKLRTIIMANDSQSPSS